MLSELKEFLDSHSRDSGLGCRLKLWLAACCPLGVVFPPPWMLEVVVYEALVTAAAAAAAELTGTMADPEIVILE